MSKPDNKLERQLLKELADREPINDYGEMGEASCIYCGAEVERRPYNKEGPDLPHTAKCPWFRAYRYVKKNL